MIVSDDVYVTIPRGAKDDLDAKILVDDIIKAPLVDKQELGRLSVSYEGEQILDLPLVADHPIEESGLFSRLWDFISLFLKGLFS